MSDASALWLGAVFDQLPDAALIIDPGSLRILACNQLAAKILRYQKDSLLNKEINEIESSIQAVFYWDQVKAGEYNETDSQDGYYQCCDGEVIAISKRSKPIVVDDRPLILVAFQAADQAHSAEQALLRTTSLLSATLEATADGILVTRTDGGISNINHRLAEMWQIPPALLNAGVDKDVLDFMRAQLPDANRSLLDLDDIDDQATTHPCNLDLLDGRHFECQMTPLIVQGRVSGRVYSFHDVTRRRLDEAKIRESEERFRNVFNNSPMMICLVSFPDGKIIDMNEACRRAYRVDRYHVPDWPATELDVWADSDERDLYIYQLQAEGEVRNFEAVMRRRDGSLFPVQYSANLLSLRNGQLSLLSMQDISTRKQAERMQHVQHTISEAAHSASDINDLCQRLHMIVNEQIPAQNLFVALAEGDRSASAQFSYPYVVDEQQQGEAPSELTRALAASVYCAGNPQLFTEHALKSLFDADLSERPQTWPSAWLGVPLMSNQQCIGVVGVSSYAPGMRYTDRDEALLQFVANQVNMVMERKQAEAQQRLLDETLQQRNVELEKASRVKSEFLANMSHEIRTPMNAIIGLSRLCLGTDLNAQQRDYVEKVFHAGSSLLGIINDILDISKVEAGKLELEAIPFSLDAVFDNLRNLVSTRVQEKGLQLVIERNDDRPRLLGDPLRLGQVLLNLVGNAIKFTERGEVRIGVRQVDAQDQGVTLEFSVKDSGIGMSEAHRQRLFQPFSQADASTTRKYGGTGLGLAISKNLVELMGGQIEVDSELGSGTCFRFSARFGLVTGERLEAGEARPVGALSFDVEACLRGRHVLLVEDNLINQQIAREWLAKAGLQVSLASNGREALDTLASQAFDWVLMDLQMPEMDGFEATRRIREQAHFKDLPVIAMTANAMASDRQACLAAGMNDHLPKPIDPDQLFRTLAHWMPQQPAIEPGDTIATACSVEPAVSGMALPAQLPGIDLERALSNTGGNASLLRSLLQIFLRDHGEDEKRIRQALDSGDHALAQRLAHTLKGIAGSLAAEPLHLAAKQLDQALRQQAQPQCGALLKALETALDPLICGLRDALAESASAPAPAGKSLDHAALLEMIEAIGQRVAEFDPEAETIAAELCRQCGDHAATASADLLARQLAAYDFEAAGATLQQLRQALETAS
ncbi:ATP-binding protein [Pseudomarimonas arenosa]|uniref:Sensory/regulatory protein RpfC n=1 Tax=Pseudomarimonas arenosa TaxID=2774145 RepID=A0AAW3ZHV6_9GAMM|nr:ATP-binding protein [Pseudomarimonas arenosa]MBD8524287.1 response regulator [Pseudomarimonas arenosa]